MKPARGKQFLLGDVVECDGVMVCSSSQLMREALTADDLVWQPVGARAGDQLSSVCIDGQT